MIHSSHEAAAEADRAALRALSPQARLDRLLRMQQAIRKRSIDEIPAAFLSRADLILNKRATARPQDLADVAALEALDD